MNTKEMRECRDNGKQCTYGICDECPVTLNPSELDDEEDMVPMPREVAEHFGVGSSRDAEA